MNNMKNVLAYVGARIGKPPGWERIVRIFAPPASCRDMGEICMVRDGITFLARPGVPLGWHVAFFGSYEPELRDLFRTILTPGGVAVDVGANIGWHSLLLAKLVGAQGRVIAVEANPTVRQKLQYNVDLNRFTQVDVLDCALSDRDGTVSFHGPEETNPDSGNGYVVRKAAEASSSALIQVKARRLDDVVSSAGLTQLDLVKIDVEGFEWPVLQGGAAAVAKYRPHIIFEYDSAYSSRGGGTPRDLASFFANLDYRLFAIQRNWMRPVSEANWPSCSNIWAVSQRSAAG